MTPHLQDEGGTVWLLSLGERELLLTLLSRPPLPRLPTPLSRTDPALDRQVLAELAGELEGHRGRTRGRLIALLRGAVEIPRPSTQPPTESPTGSAGVEPQGGGAESGGCLLRLTMDDREVFLQALNELRLGAWEQLGCPDPPELPESLAPTSPDLLHWWTLEIASRFQSRILAEAFPE